MGKVEPGPTFQVGMIPGTARLEDGYVTVVHHTTRS